MDYKYAWPSATPDGTGWKRALAAFTGDRSVAQFYAAFEQWMAAIIADGDVSQAAEAVESLASPHDSDAERFAEMQFSSSGKPVHRAAFDICGECDGCECAPCPGRAVLGRRR